MENSNNKVVPFIVSKTSTAVPAAPASTPKQLKNSRTHAKRKASTPEAPATMHLRRVHGRSYWRGKGRAPMINPVIAYHGTTESAAEQIKREGLRPHRQTAFQIQIAGTQAILRNEPEEQMPWAYVTFNRDVAESFAHLRANYERVPKSSIIPDTCVRFVNEFVKLSDRVNPSARPALVEITLPPSWKRKLTQDPAHTHGFVTSTPIPPKYIARVEVLERDEL